MRQMGEVAYYAMRKSEGTQWILAHPARFARLTALRIVYFWFTPVYGFAKGLFMGLLTVSGFVGLWMLFRAHSPHAAPLAGVWLLFPIPYYFLHVGPRYRYPIDWMFWLLASYALCTLMSRYC